MIKFKINGKPCTFPTSWAELSMREYCEVLKGNGGPLQLISLRSGLDYEIVKKSTILGLETLVVALQFMNKPPEVPGVVTRVGKYDLPLNSKGLFNIQMETLGQFEDMREAMKKITDIHSQMEFYAAAVAIYLQKIRDGEYNPDKAKAMVDEVMEMPSLEVISAGSFFFLKLMSLLSGTPKTSPKARQTPKKSKRVLKPSRKSSDRTRK